MVESNTDTSPSTSVGTSSRGLACAQAPPPPPAHAIGCHQVKGDALLAQRDLVFLCEGRERVLVKKWDRHARSSATKCPFGKPIGKPGSDQQEFYQLLSYEIDVDLEAKLSEWGNFSNINRPHGASNGKTPIKL